MSDINAAAEAITGDWVKLNRREHDAVEGRVLSFDQRPMTFEGSAVLNRTTGQQRTEWVFVVQRDDGETVKFSLKESGQRAVAEAIKANGQPAKIGDRLKVGVKDDPEDEHSQPVYQARWTTESTPLDIPGTEPETEPF